MWSLLTIGYFAFAVGLHAATARLKPAGNRVLQFLLAGGACGAALVLHLTRMKGITSPEWLAGVAVYAFVCELYVFLFTFVTSSVSVALLVGQGDAGGPSLSPAEMVGQRLHTMSAAGLLDYHDGRFQLNRRSSIMVAVYRGLRRFFRHDTLPE